MKGTNKDLPKDQLIKDLGHCIRVSRPNIDGTAKCQVLKNILFEGGIDLVILQEIYTEDKALFDSTLMESKHVSVATEKNTFLLTATKEEDIHEVVTKTGEKFLQLTSRRALFPTKKKKLAIQHHLICTRYVHWIRNSGKY